MVARDRDEHTMLHTSLMPSTPENLLMPPCKRPVIIITWLWLHQNRSNLSQTFRFSMIFHVIIPVCRTKSYLMMKGMKGASPRGEEDPSMGEG